MKQSKSNQPLPRFQKIKRIGEGTYGTVTKVYDNKMKIFIAVKKIKFYDQEQTIPINALREITSLKQLNHPNIIKLFAVTYEPQKRKLYINCQYVQQTLYQHICKNKNLSINTIKVQINHNKNFTYQILKALLYLAEKGYMHRDLKPQNIMVTNNCKIKLIDFGQIKKINIGNLEIDKNTLEISTLWYKAPELLLGYEYYNNKIDIWALGCIIVEMATGNPLFQGKSQIEQIFKIFDAFGTPRLNDNPMIRKWQYFTPNLPKFQEKNIYLPCLGQKGNNLLKQMLQINAQKRLNITQALKHEFFQGLQ